jgi:hypothetical protein
MAKSKRITAKKFKAAMGRDPIQDELERANCAQAGEMGHWGCGWCENCNKPRTICPCETNRRMAERVMMVTIPLTYVNVVPTRLGSDAPRGPVGPKDPRPMTDVEREIARADMAFLIAKEKESGDWDKWLDSQKNWTGVDRDANGRFTAAERRRPR